MMCFRRHGVPGRERCSMNAQAVAPEAVLAQSPDVQSMDE